MLLFKRTNVSSSTRKFSDIEDELLNH
jgi:hypothetical protein